MKEEIKTKGKNKTQIKECLTDLLLSGQSVFFITKFQCHKLSCVDICNNNLFQDHAFFPTWPAVT